MEETKWIIYKYNRPKEWTDYWFTICTSSDSYEVIKLGIKNDIDLITEEHSWYKILAWMTCRAHPEKPEPCDYKSVEIETYERIITMYTFLNLYGITPCVSARSDLDNVELELMRTIGRVCRNAENIADMYKADGCDIRTIPFLM